MHLDCNMAFYNIIYRDLVIFCCWKALHCCCCCFHQAFASERVFGVLSETLYNLLQLVGDHRFHLSSFLLLFEKKLSQQFGFFFHTHYPFYQDWEQRQEEDNLLIERILVLVRNVLHVPTDPCEEKVCIWVNYANVKRHHFVRESMPSFTFCFAPFYHASP